MTLSYIIKNKWIIPLCIIILIMILFYCFWNTDSGVQFNKIDSRLDNEHHAIFQAIQNLYNVSKNILIQKRDYLRMV